MPQIWRSLLLVRHKDKQKWSGKVLTLFYCIHFRCVLDFRNFLPGLFLISLVVNLFYRIETSKLNLANVKILAVLLNSQMNFWWRFSFPMSIQYIIHLVCRILFKRHMCKLFAILLIILFLVAKLLYNYLCPSVRLGRNLIYSGCN